MSEHRASAASAVCSHMPLRLLARMMFARIFRFGSFLASAVCSPSAAPGNLALRPLTVWATGKETGTVAAAAAEGPVLTTMGLLLFLLLVSVGILTALHYARYLYRTISAVNKPYTSVTTLHGSRHVGSRRVRGWSLQC